MQPGDAKPGDAKSHQSKPRIAELDAIRGLAAASVVLFHFTTRYDQIYHHTASTLMSFSLGYFGVQLFFSLSGFVIFMTLQRTARPMDFIVSRFSRLYPAYWASVLLTTAVVSAAGMLEFQHSAWVVAVNLTMLQGFVHVPDVDGAYWTLLVELCFYAAMLGLFQARQLHRIEVILAAWIGLKWAWWQFPNLSFTLGALLIVKHIPFFSIGIMAYRIHAGVRSVAEAAPVVGFALLSILVIDGWMTFAVGVLTAAVLIAFACGRLGWLGARPLVWLGGISYTLYLLHENIGMAVIKGLEAGGVEANLAILAALAASVFLATLVTYGVERPAMRWIRSRRHAR